MRKLIIGGFIFFVIVNVIIFTMVVSVLDSGVKKAKQSYEKPDTSIVIKNGKADTIITKKSAPAWLN